MPISATHILVLHRKAKFFWTMYCHALPYQSIQNTAQQSLLVSIKTSFHDHQPSVVKVILFHSDALLVDAERCAVQLSNAVCRIAFQYWAIVASSD